MGDRVLIQLKHTEADTGKTVYSPVVYMHWSGDQAPDYIKETAKLMQSRGPDLPYCFARLVGVCHSHIEGNLSLGVWNQSGALTKADSHGDAGCYLVDVNTWEAEAFGGYGKSFTALEPTTSEHTGFDNGSQ